MTAWEHWVLLALNFLLSLALISKEYSNLVCFLHIVQLFSKVHMLCEGHKILQNLHQLFVRCTASQKLGEISPDFVAFSEYMNFNRDSFVIGLKSRGSSLTQEKTGSLD